MNPSVLARYVTPEKVRLARLIALAADFVQVIAFPLFSMGALSPANNVLDLLVALLMTFLLGWHWAFLPTFLAEGVPLLDLFPTWTAAVYYVTRGQAPHPEPAGPISSPRKGESPEHRERTEEH